MAPIRARGRIWQECVGNFVFGAMQWRPLGREEEYGSEQGFGNRR